MSTVIGPFDQDDFYTMSELKKDLAFIRRKKKSNPEYALVETQQQDKLNSYLTRVA